MRSNLVVAVVPVTQKNHVDALTVGVVTLVMLAISTTGVPVNMLQIRF